MKRSWFFHLPLALASGALLALAYPNYNLHFLAWISIALLIVAVLGAGMRSAALFGFLHGIVFATISVPWIYTVLRVHGNADQFSAAGAMAALVIAWALFPAAFALIIAWVGRRSVVLACLAAPFVIVALEFVRTNLPYIGFPWNLLGYPAAVNLSLLQLTAWTGIWGLSLLVAGYNALLAWALLVPPSHKRRAWQMLGGVTLALVLVIPLGALLVPKAEAHHTARLVQLNFPEAQSYPSDWMAIHATEMDELERLSVSPQKGRADFIVWPEVPAPFSTQDPVFMGRAQRIAQTAGADSLFGVVDWRPGPNNTLLPYNSAVLLDATGRRVFLYDKIHLVAFGEYVPLRRWLKFAQSLTAEIGDFTPGTEYKVGELAGGRKFGAFICFEAVFPNLVRRFPANGAQLLVNISNDGWFGGTSAPAQHFMMARVRAVEHRRWLLRSTNTGFTASVDPYGRLAARLQPDIRGALDAPYGFRSDITLYTHWGDWLAWLSVLASALLIFAAARTGSSDPRITEKR
jgi:apolipoprotein N-acyltransferase